MDKYLQTLLAYFCFCMLKKTSGNFVSNQIMHPPAEGLQEDMLATGPICRYASDLRTLFKVFAGPRYKEG